MLFYYNFCAHCNNIGGRLGNQLYYILQAYKNPQPCKYVFLKKYDYTNVFASLKLLNINKYMILDKELQIQNGDKFIIDNQDNYHQFINIDFSKDKLFNFIKDTILKSEIFNNIKLQYNINNNNIIGIHIRNGDYLYNVNNFLNYFNRLEYFKDCFDDYKKNIDEIHIFSDDIQLTKKIYNDLFLTKCNNIKYIINSNPLQDMLQLSLYKNKIILNSTFALWSAYISAILYKDHIVYVPNKYNILCKDNETNYLDSFIKINVKRI